MLPDDLLIVTRVAQSGMLVRDVYRECLSARVQSLPVPRRRRAGSPDG